MYGEALLPLNNRKCRTKKKNEGKSDIRRTGVVGCLFFERLGWGGWEITSARGGALLSPTRPTSSFRPFVLCPPYRSHFYPSRSSSALKVKHGDCKLSSVYSLAPKILFKATNAVVDESNARKWKKKTVLLFYRRNKNSPFWKPVNSRISWMDFADQYLLQLGCSLWTGIFTMVTELSIFLNLIRGMYNILTGNRSSD